MIYIAFEDHESWNILEKKKKKREGESPAVFSLLCPLSVKSWILAEDLS